MKKKYTKKQICEAITYWKKQLNENNSNSVFKEYFSELVSDPFEHGDHDQNMSDWWEKLHGDAHFQQYADAERHICDVILNKISNNENISTEQHALWQKIYNACDKFIKMTEQKAIAVQNLIDLVHKYENEYNDPLFRPPSKKLIKSQGGGWTQYK